MKVREALDLCTNTLNNETGFEIYPFQVGWYNEKVNEKFRLKQPDHTLGIVALSVPCMFEKTFIPWLLANETRLPTIKDLIDECMQDVFNETKNLFSNVGIEVDIIYDFDMNQAFRRPKVVMTTVGHVAGAAYYYQASDATIPGREPDKKFLGLSLHPLYGGWFAFRACMIFKNVDASNLHKVEPLKSLTNDNQIIETLKLFNYNWEDYRYRDTVPVLDRYSDKQRLYFSTKPSERRSLVENWLKNSELI